MLVEFGDDFGCITDGNFDREVGFTDLVSGWRKNRFVINKDIHVARQSINGGSANSVETPGSFVSRLSKLATGMKSGHKDFEGGNAFGRMEVGRNTTAIIGNRGRAIFV